MLKAFGVLVLFADTLFGADLTIMEEGTELLHRLKQHLQEVRSCTAKQGCFQSTVGYSRVMLCWLLAGALAARLSPGALGLRQSEYVDLCLCVSTKCHQVPVRNSIFQPDNLVCVFNGMINMSVFLVSVSLWLTGSQQGGAPAHVHLLLPRLGGHGGEVQP